MQYRFIKPMRPVTRVFLHCSASDLPEHDSVAVMEEWHLRNGWSGVAYHFFGRKDGTGEFGRSLEKIPAAQRGHNDRTIAICLHGLSPDKFTDAQKIWLINLCAQIKDTYRGLVTFHGHNEVAKKDCPVIDYKDILGLDEHGHMSAEPTSHGVEMVSHQNLTILEDAEAGGWAPVSIKFGDTGPYVVRLQEDMADLGYHVGEIDGVYGRLLRAAVLSFQADNYLVEDGIVGRATIEALQTAQPRELSIIRQEKTITELAKDGSRIAQASIANTQVGGALTVGGALAVVEESTGVISELTNQAESFKGVVEQFGPLVGGLILVAGLVVVVQSQKAGRARRADHQTGRTL